MRIKRSIPLHKQRIRHISFTLPHLPVLFQRMLRDISHQAAVPSRDGLVGPPDVGRVLLERFEGEEGFETVDGAEGAKDAEVLLGKERDGERVLEWEKKRESGRGDRYHDARPFKRRNDLLRRPNLEFVEKEHLRR